MKSLHIITPVKDSIDTTIDTIKAIMSSDIKVPFTYTIYNDFSTPENTQRLEKASKEYGFQLVNLSDLTDHPSPNYLLVLQKTQKEAIEANAGLLIVESDALVSATMGMYPLQEAGTFAADSSFWTLLAFCAVTGGSLLIIGSAAGVTVMGMEKISFGYYLKRFSPLVLLGFFAGVLVYMFLC